MIVSSREKFTPTVSGKVLVIELFRRCAVGEMSQVFLKHNRSYKKNKMYVLVSDNRYRFRNKRQLEIIYFDLFV